MRLKVFQFAIYFFEEKKMQFSIERVISFLSQNIIKHESYSLETKKNDIALIQLSKEIVFTPSIRAVCIETNPNDESPNVKLIVTGWGSTKPDSKHSEFICCIVLIFTQSFNCSFILMTLLFY